MVKHQESLSASFRTKSPYRICICGVLNFRWSEWFSGIEISMEHSETRPPFTILTCPAIDQARLRGILNRIWDLNLSLIALQQIPDPTLEATLPDGC
jgi:hypothetical protein